MRWESITSLKYSGFPLSCKYLSSPLQFNVTVLSIPFSVFNYLQWILIIFTFHKMMNPGALVCHMAKRRHEITIQQDLHSLTIESNDVSDVKTFETGKWRVYTWIWELKICFNKFQVLHSQILEWEKIRTLINEKGKFSKTLQTPTFGLWPWEDKWYWPEAQNSWYAEQQLGLGLQPRKLSSVCFQSLRTDSNPDGIKSVLINLSNTTQLSLSKWKKFEKENTFF